MLRLPCNFASRDQTACLLHQAPHCYNLNVTGPTTAVAVLSCSQLYSHPFPHPYPHPTRGMNTRACPDQALTCRLGRGDEGQRAGPHAADRQHCCSSSSQPWQPDCGHSIQGSAQRPHHSPRPVRHLSLVPNSIVLNSID